jgi:hypothetical protein
MDAELSKLRLADALSRVGIGVFVLDLIGRVVFSNEVGGASLGDGLEMIDGRLVAAQAAQSQQAPMQKQVVNCDPAVLIDNPRPILTHRHGEQRPLALYVLPIPAASTGLLMARLAFSNRDWTGVCPRRPAIFFPLHEDRHARIGPAISAVSPGETAR